MRIQHNRGWVLPHPQKELLKLWVNYIPMSVSAKIMSLATRELSSLAEK